MAGKSKRHEHLSEVESIAKTKQEVIDFYRETGMKTAACNFVGRDIVTINKWEAADPEFKAALLKSKAQYVKGNRHRVKLDNQFANLYPEDFRPPRQEADINLTTVEGQSAEALLAEAKRLGLDTTPYESLLTRTASGTPGQDQPQE